MPGNRDAATKARLTAADSIKVFLKGTFVPGSSKNPTDGERKKRDEEAEKFPEIFAEFEKVGK